MTQLSVLSALTTLLATLVTCIGLGLVSPPAVAQTAPPVYTTRIPVSYYAPATASGEAVLFTGTGTISSRVSRDAATGASSLLATFDTNGIVGTGYPSLTKYVLNSHEQMVLPHTWSQKVQLSFPMEPAPGSAVTRLRSGTVNLTFMVEMATGKVLQISSSSLSLL
ncbi:MAG: hypothetical protein KAX42_00355 [Sphaerotilus sp.]|nr:hypothetical protein [Sphaerotilus sp.]